MNKQWIDICDIDDIPEMSAVCALHQGKQVAIFNLADRGGIKSICNFDPIGNASVLSRGLVAEVDGRTVVASPLFKQHYCLDTGECLQDETIQVNVYTVRVKNKRVQLKATT